MEETLIVIKPDAFEKGCAGEILDRFLKRDFIIIAMKKITPTSAMVDGHYSKKFLEKPHIREEVIRYLTSGPVIALILRAENAIAKARKIIGSLTKASIGTIRGDYPSDILRNLAHSSDSLEDADHEMRVWFSEDENMIKFNNLNEVEKLFAAAITFQKEKLYEPAKTAAQKCLAGLYGRETYTETASGHVVSLLDNTICLPDFLHTATAEKRFKEIGIL